MFRTRERGMSYWPFVVTLIALLVMTYMWYEAGRDDESQRSTITRLTQEKAAAEQKWRAERGTLQDLVDKTGYVNEQGLPDGDRLRAGIDEALTAMREAGVLKLKTAKFSQTGEGGKMEEIGQGEFVVRYLPPASELPASPTVEAMWPIVTGAMRRMVADVNHHVQLKATAESGRASASDEHKNALTAKDTEIGDLRRQLQAEQARAAEQAQELRDENATLTSQLETLRSEFEESRSQAEDAVAALENKLSQAKGEITRLVDREVPFVSEGHDGEVLTSGPGIVIINRGKKDMLMPGTVFSVYKRVKGGGEVNIGTIKATVVGDDTSRCAVLEAADVISGGDMISSSTYSPDRQLRFVLLGEFQKMGKSSATRRLEQLGAKVDGEVSTMTHYVVLGTPGPGGEPLESTADYQRAKTLGIKIITEEQLSSFTQY